MSEQAYCCDFCGVPVSTADLAGGHGMMLMKKKFCRECLQKAVERSKARPTASKHNSAPSSTVTATLEPGTAF